MCRQKMMETPFLLTDAAWGDLKYQKKANHSPAIEPGFSLEA